MCDSTVFTDFLAQEPVVLDDTGAPLIEGLMADPAYGDHVAYTFRHFPFSTDPAVIAVKDHRAADYAADASLALVLADRQAGQLAGVTGTPSIYVDGRKVVPWVALKEVLDCLLGYAP